MKKTLRTLLLAALMALTLCATALAEDTTYQINAEYNDALCDFVVTYMEETEGGWLEEGEVVTGNTVIAGKSILFEICNIADGYRIGTVTMNGSDYSDGFIEGAYGSISTTASRDYDIKIEIEKIPAELPAIASAEVWTYQSAGPNSVLVTDSVTVTEEMRGLHAKVKYSDGEDHPDYYATGSWEYSFDGGTTWQPFPGWGTHRTDIWMGWPWFESDYGINFLTKQDYLARIRLSARENYSTVAEGTYYYSDPVMINPTSGDSGDSTSMAVTNVRFQNRFGLPYLYWDVPVEKSDEVYYAVYLSADNGATFKKIGNTRSEKTGLSEVAPGVYNAVKIVTQVNWEDVAECIVTDLTLTIKDGGMLEAPSVTAAQQEDGRYQFSVSGLPANTIYWFGVEDESGIGVGTSVNTDENGAFKVTYGASDMENFLKEDMGYVLQKFTDIAVSADGKSASMTISDRGGWTKLSTLFGGEDTEPGNQTGYGMKVYLEPPALIAMMTGPANATTDPVFDYEFYSSTDDSVFAGLGCMPLNAAQAFAFSAGTYDSYRVRHENGEIMGEGKLSKPIISTHDAFTISGVTLSAEGVQDDGRTRFHLQGLDLENYTYTLETESSGFYIYSEWLTAAADRLANGAVLYAYRNSEDDTAFYQQRSVGLELTVGGESGGSGGNEDGGDTGTDAADAVSNIHFEMLSGLPYLYWDAPASSSEEMRYEVFFSTDGGKNWELLSGTSQTFISLGNVATGSYNAVKVTTEVDNETVAECVAADVALTITQGAQLAPAKVVFKKLDDGRYEATVSGLTPNVYYHFMMKAGGSASSSGSTTGDNGTFTKTYDAQKIEKYLSKDGAYLVQEHTDGAVSADGKSASMTVSNRGDWVKLADALKGGSAETPTVSGTVTNGGGASIEINGQSVQVNEDGSFEIPAEGTFDVAIKKGGCLTYTIKGVSAENGNVELPEVVLVAGDVNEDGKINIADMGVFRQNFGKTDSNIGNAYTDVNEDGKVNIQDMGTFRANFGKTAEKDCTVEYGA